jgi:hypothetical protein
MGFSQNGFCDRKSRKIERGQTSGTEEHVFALEHFHTEEEGYSCVDASGKENDGDEIPVIRAGSQFLAQQAGVENRNESEFGVQVDGKHGGNRWDDDDEHQRADVALRFLVAFGEERDGHESSGKEHRNRQDHDENGKHRREVNLQL